MISSTVLLYFRRREDEANAEKQKLSQYENRAKALLTLKKSVDKSKVINRHVIHTCEVIRMHSKLYSVHTCT